jgi:hypothetical protein
MKTLYLTSLLCLFLVFSKGQNCPQTACSISVSVSQDSCPSSPQTFNVSAYPFISVCAADVPSAAAPDQTSANYCTSSDPSNTVSCPGSQYVTAHVYTPIGFGITNPMSLSTIASVYFKLADSTLLNYMGQPTAVGADAKVWLKSPAGSYLLLTNHRALNSDYATTYGNYCYCPTFTTGGSDGVIPIMDGPFNKCNYLPDGGPIGYAYVGENPFVNAGEWTLCVNDNVSAGGASHGGLRIIDFCIAFQGNVSISTTYTWTSDSANCLAHLSSTTIANPVFTPPSVGSYDCTYYLTVYDSVSGCSGSDTVHLSCPNTISVEEINSDWRNFHVHFSNSVLNSTHQALNNPATLIINNTNGKEVCRYYVQVGSTSEKVKLPELTKGVYVARLVGEGVSANTKFVVE